MYVSKLSFKYDGLGPRLLAGMNGGGTLKTQSPKWIVGGSADSARGWEEDEWASDSTGNSWCVGLGFSQGNARIHLLVSKEEEEESLVAGKTKVTFIIRDSNGCAVLEKSEESSKIGFTCRDFVEPKQLLENSGIIDKGALVIDAIIQPALSSGWSPAASAPSSLGNNLLKLFERNALTDMGFHLPNKDGSSRWIFAHKLILAANAPGICSFFEDEEDPGMVTKVFVTGASEEVFRRVLRYIYGGGLPTKAFLLEHGFELIGVADKYDLVELKLEVEEALVASRSLTVSTVVEHILFADSHNCALLREYAMEYFLARSEDVLASGAFTQLGQSPKLMKELWASVGRGVAAVNRDGDGIGSMQVYKLRKLLRKKKLDVDGSKAMLVARLEGNAGGE